MMTDFKLNDYVCCAMKNKTTNKFILVWFKVLFIDNNGMFSGEILSKENYGNHLYTESKNVFFIDDNFSPNMFHTSTVKTFDSMHPTEVSAIAEALDILIDSFISIITGLDASFEDISYEQACEDRYPFRFALKMKLEEFKEKQMTNQFTLNCYRHIFKDNSLQIENKIIDAIVLDKEFFEKTTNI